MNDLNDAITGFVLCYKSPATKARSCIQGYQWATVGISFSAEAADRLPLPLRQHIDPTSVTRCQKRIKTFFLMRCQQLERA